MRSIPEVSIYRVTFENGWKCYVSTPTVWFAEQEAKDTVGYEHAIKKISRVPCSPLKSGRFSTAMQERAAAIDAVRAKIAKEVAANPGRVIDITR